MVDQNSAGRKLRWGALEFYAKAHIDFDLGAKFGSLARATLDTLAKMKRE